MNLSKVIKYVFLVTVLAMLLSPTEGRTSPSEEKTVELRVYSLWQDAEAANFEAALSAYTEKSGVKVVHQSKSGEEIRTSVLTEIAGGSPPDLVASPYVAWIRELAGKNQVEDLTPIIGPMEDQFIGSTFIDAVKFDGKIFAAPFKAWIKPGMYYNKRLYQQYGITEPKTWNDLEAVCEKLLRAGIQPIASAGKAAWNLADFMEMVILRVGGKQLHHNLITHETSWTDPKVKEVFERIVHLIDKGYFGTDPIAEDWMVQVTRLGKGEIGMFNMGNWLNLMLLKDFPNFEWNEDYYVFPFPRIYQQIPIGVVVGGDWVFMCKGSKHPKEARALIKWLAGPESQQIIAKKGGWIATNKNVAVSVYDPADKSAVDVALNSETVPDLDQNIPPELNTILRKKLQEIWVRPQKWQEILSEIEAEAQRIY